MSCPTYIGTLPNCTDYGCALSPDGSRVWYPVSGGGSDWAVGSVTWPGLSGYSRFSAASTGIAIIHSLAVDSAGQVVIAGALAADSKDSILRDNGAGITQLFFGSYFSSVMYLCPRLDDADHVIVFDWDFGGSNDVTILDLDVPANTTTTLATISVGTSGESLQLSQPTHATDGSIWYLVFHTGAGDPAAEVWRWQPSTGATKVLGTGSGIFGGPNTTGPLIPRPTGGVVSHFTSPAEEGELLTATSLPAFAIVPEPCFDTLDLPPFGPLDPRMAAYGTTSGAADVAITPFNGAFDQVYRWSTPAPADSMTNWSVTAPGWWAP